MAAKIIDGKCICTIDDLDFEISTDDDYCSGIDSSWDEYYITAYIHKYGIKYVGLIGGSTDKDKAVEAFKLYYILKKVISVGMVRLEATDPTMNTLIFTEEYVFDDVIITRYQLTLYSTTKGNMRELISRKAEETLKKDAEKALHDRLAFLEQENAELRDENARLQDKNTKLQG